MRSQKKDKKSKLQKLNTALTVSRVVSWILGVAVGAVVIGCIVYAAKMLGVELQDIFGK